MEQFTVEKEELLEQYEARGDAAVFVEAKRLYEAAVETAPDASVLVGYGYLLYCHSQYTLRQAVELYERAIELDPSADKPHWQLIGAYAALREPERAIALYEQRFAASPADLRQRRFLASGYIAGHEYAKAREVIDGGLQLAPDDRAFIEFRGDVRAGTGDPDGALADWRRALELDTENISAAYCTAFLLEREGRINEAVYAWRFIVDWCESRGAELTAEWPKRELERLAS